MWPAPSADARSRDRGAGGLSITLTPISKIFQHINQVRWYESLRLEPAVMGLVDAS
jgi:hypothetical protein